MLVQRVDVGALRADREQAGVDARIERLHPSVEDLGEAGVVLDRPGLDALLLELARRAAGGDDLDVELGQAAGEVDQPALVGNAQQRAPDLYLAGRGHLGAARLIDIVDQHQARVGGVEADRAPRR